MHKNTYLRLTRIFRYFRGYKKFFRKIYFQAFDFDKYHIVAQ